ncbi:MAG TPA: pirin family protein [Pseudonocardiaceae bacterium]|jgi:redox-sensitive bicupin YhaK (pirin superfamily)|nr:pirin family protein [Pseudonocardiaceae bacterium]
MVSSPPKLVSQVDVRRAGERKHTAIGWLNSRHSFSFGRHFDPANTHFGLLLVNNDDVVQAGMGFEIHPHRDMEIVTWVLDGSLVHQDSQGNSGVIYPGLAQRMSAGTGIQHSEKNDSWRSGGHKLDEQRHDHDVHFVQMWIPPDTRSIDPSYEQLDINSELGPVNAGSGELVVVASGMDTHRDRSAVFIRQQHAALHAARLQPGASLDLPAAAFVHLFLARGTVDLEGTGPLDTGDAARMTAAGGQQITAGPNGAEVLVWEMAARLAA